MSNKEKGSRDSKYDAKLVVKMWEGGMRPSEIRRSDKPGVKGISSAFVSRILFGTTWANRQTAEQKERSKAEVSRRKQRYVAKAKALQATRRITVSSKRTPEVK